MKNILNDIMEWIVISLLILTIPFIGFPLMLYIAFINNVNFNIPFPYDPEDFLSDSELVDQNQQVNEVDV